MLKFSSCNLHVTVLEKMIGQWPLRYCPYDAIVTTIYFLQLIGCMGFSIVVTIVPYEQLHSISCNLFCDKNIAVAISPCDQPFKCSAIRVLWWKRRSNILGQNIQCDVSGFSKTVEYRLFVQSDAWILLSNPDFIQFLILCHPGVRVFSLGHDEPRESRRQE